MCVRGIVQLKEDRALFFSHLAITLSPASPPYTSRSAILRFHLFFASSGCELVSPPLLLSQYGAFVFSSFSSTSALFSSRGGEGGRGKLPLVRWDSVSAVFSNNPG